MDALAYLGIHDSADSFMPMSDVTLTTVQPDPNTLLVTVPGDVAHKPITFTMVTTPTDSQNTSLHVSSDMPSDLSLDDGQAHRLTPDKINDMLRVELGGMVNQLERGASPSAASASLHMVLQMVGTSNNDAARARWQRMAADPKAYGREAGLKAADRYLDTTADAHHLTAEQREKIHQALQSSFSSSPSNNDVRWSSQTSTSSPQSQTNPWAN